MNRRRLTGLCLIAALLLIPAVVHADVGNSFSGGSGYSGGGYSGGGYSGGSGLGGMFFFMGGGGGSILGAIIMILIIVAWAYFSKNTQNSRRQDTPYQGGVSHRICNETAAVSALREIDPQFSVEGFKSFASEVYLTLQEAWERKDQPSEHAECAQHHHCGLSCGWRAGGAQRKAGSKPAGLYHG